MSHKRKTPATRNPVAKFANRFQRAATFRDKTQYRRNAKHKRRESFPAAAV